MMVQQHQQQQQKQHTVIDIPLSTSNSIKTLKFDVKYSADRYKCCPPPLFVIFVSLLEVGVFVYGVLKPEKHERTESSSLSIPSSSLSSSEPLPINSILIYRPDRRQEIWRFISYMVLHANWFHLCFNVIVQLIIGLPLEMVHGSIRIACIYLSGIFAGSLGTSIVDSEVFLVGASGGVYALLAAHLANILVNFGEIKYGISKLISILIFASCDFGYAIYSRYVLENNSTSSSVSYVAHLTGALAGLTIGILVLKNFDHHSNEYLLWWSALGIYTAFTIFAIVFNLLNSMTGQMLEEKGEVIKQHLFHDLGVS